MISLLFAALFGSNSRNLDQTSNQQLFGYEQPHQPPPPQTQPPNRSNSVYGHQVYGTNPVTNQQPTLTTIHPPPPQQEHVSVVGNNSVIPHRQSIIMVYSSYPPPVNPQSEAATIRVQQVETVDMKPSAPSESHVQTYPPQPSHMNTSLNETINTNLNYNQPQPTGLTEPQLYNTNVQLNIQKPGDITQVNCQPGRDPNQPITMNPTVSGSHFTSVDITKPFSPISNNYVIGNGPFGQRVCYQQGFNNGIRVNQQVVQTGDVWVSEHEYGTNNVCFRISPQSGEQNPFSGLVLGFTGIANHKPPAGHTHFIVFNNILQRIEKRAYPNDCRPSMQNARYMLLESMIIPYNLIASFEVDCIGGRVNKQSLSCVVCKLISGHSIRVNHDEMDTVSMSAEKAQFMYQALNYSLAILKHKQSASFPIL